MDEPELDLVVRRRGLREPLPVAVRKEAGEPLGIEVSSAVFDRVRTCDNHCEFCFIHQLPKGMRRSLSMKDDDYRLSFLYGNFTTLTRFTEMDLERVLTERLEPAVRVDPRHRPRRPGRHAAQPAGRHQPALARAPCSTAASRSTARSWSAPGATTVPCWRTPWPACSTGTRGSPPSACVPLGVSTFSHEDAMRPHTVEEAAAVCDLVERWQATFLSSIGRRMVYAADEYYLMAERPFPPAATYEGFPQHENGLGMARAFEAAFGGDEHAALGVRPGLLRRRRRCPGGRLPGPRLGAGAADDARRMADGPGRPRPSPS